MIGDCNFKYSYLHSYTWFIYNENMYYTLVWYTVLEKPPVQKYKKRVLFSIDVTSECGGSITKTMFSVNKSNVRYVRTRVELMR
jgi:hypothetical protein